MIIKNQKINCLLIALTGALCLSACASGTSSSPTPPPTPSPSPTPTPPGPTPTPTPVAGESGVYAISPFSLSMSFATQPSAANWVNFTSGTTNSIAGLIATESRIALLDRPAVTGGDTTSQYNIYGGTEVQIGAANTSLSVTISSSAQADGTLPLIAANQIATNGNNVVVAAPSTVDGTYAVTAYTLYSIAANGKPSAITSYYNTSGTSTALAPVAAQPVVVFINGMYYAYNMVTGSVLYSQDGTTWQQALISGGDGNTINNVVQVSGSVFAVQSANTHVYLGSGPFTFATTRATTLGAASDLIAANGSGRLYIFDDVANAGQLAMYTPTATSLGAVVAVSTSIAPPYNLLFANQSLYLIVNSAGPLVTYPLQVNGSTITAGKPAQIVNSSAPTYLYTLADNGGFITSSGQQLYLVNGNTSYAEYHAGDLSNNGSITALSSVDFNTGMASFTNLASGMNYTSTTVPASSRQTLVAGFAGTQTGYMLALTNGGVLVSSESGFVEAAPIMHPLDGTTGEGMPADVSQLVSTNGSYLATDNGDTASGGGNLYFSDNDGASWTDIPAASLPVYPSNGPIIMTQNGYYFIIFEGEGKTYQTATPQNLTTWVEVSNLPVTTNSTKIKTTQGKNLSRYSLTDIVIYNPYKYYNGTYYTFYGNTSLGVYNPATGQTTVTDNILPQDTYYQNIAYNGTTFAIAQEASNYIWTASSLTGGPTSWTQNSATFNGINGVMDITNGIGSFLWTGKIWILGSNLPTGSLGFLPSGYVFGSNNLTSWNAATYTTPTGIQTYVNGVPQLF